MNKKRLIIIISIVAALIIAGVTIFVLVKPKEKEEPTKKSEKKEEKKEEIVEKVDIIDINSKNRPFAVVVNNTPVAVKVQEGLNQAYLVYEFPTEGATSRLMAVFKDKENVNIGTVRSARHNFIDFAYENDAIFVAHGWSHYAEKELKGGKAIINNINGMVDSCFWRNNPEGLASEHTSYTSISKLKETSKNKGYSLQSNNSVLLNYDVSDVDLSDKEGVITANRVTLYYGNITTVFNYDSNNKIYVKNVNGVDIKDHASGENFTTKNIIIEKIAISQASDGYYLNLHDVGSGEGYYITNGKAVKIKWSKNSRTSKTKYTYLDGTEIKVSDGKTYIEVHPTSMQSTVE